MTLYKEIERGHPNWVEFAFPDWDAYEDSMKAGVEWWHRSKNVRVEDVGRFAREPGMYPLYIVFPSSLAGNPPLYITTGEGEELHVA